MTWQTLLISKSRERYSKINRIIFLNYPQKQQAQTRHEIKVVSERYGVTSLDMTVSGLI